MRPAPTSPTVSHHRAVPALLSVLAVVAVLLPVGSASAAAPEAVVVFPSDELTVADDAQLTDRRVALPLPDCTELPSVCEEMRLINQLDGFDVDPRIAVQLRSVPGDVAEEFGEDTLYVEPAAGGERIGLNRFVFDPDTLVLHGRPVTQLADGTRYRVVYDGEGGRSETTFTTMSATRVLAQMRRQLDDGSAYAAAGIPEGERGVEFVREDDTRTVFDALDVVDITRYDQRSTDCDDLTPEQVLNTAVAGAGTYAFGSFVSPSWLDADRTIAQTPTRTGAPAVVGAERVGVTLVLPAGPAPEGGWPVAIFAPGITRSKYDLFLAADTNAARGLATLSLDPVGHAFGPCSEAGVTLLSEGGGEVRFSGFGRGIDQDGDGEITNQEGVSAPTQPHPKASVALRDGLRQTAADVMALVRAIARGVDVDGDGTVDLAPDGVSLYAQSLGGIYGTMVMGVDPDVQVSVLNVPGGPILDIARLSPVFRQEVAYALRDRQPCLLNGGRNGFEESLPLYLDPPVTEPVDGALAIQDVMARTNWINRPGSPETFAPLLRTRPLADSQAKDVIYQFAFGDQVVPNPTSATIARADDLFERVSFYRNDLTATRDTDPHGFLLDPRVQGRNQGQQQVVDFITSDGERITDPDGPAPTWEVPIAEPEMLEQLNFDEALYEEPTPAPEGCGVAAAEALQPAPARDEGSDGTAGAPLPATGGGTATSLLGVALLASAGLVARRRRSLPRSAR